jgi:hypothetical protein
MGVALAVGTVLISGALLVAFGSGQSKSANSPNAAPRPCVVGTPGCGPLPRLPTQHTPVPPHRHRGGAPRRGLLRPGSYDRSYGVGFDLRFTVPTGWSWNGQALRQGDAAIYFTTSPVRVYSDPCHWDRPQHLSPGLYTPGSVESVAAALAAQPMRYATRPWLIPSSLAAPTRGGPTARSVDAIEVRLTVPSNLDFSRCDHGQYRSWGVGRNARTQQGPGQRDLIWLQGTGPGARNLMIDAATFPDTPSRLVHQVDAILASVEAGCWNLQLGC